MEEIASLGITLLEYLDRVGKHVDLDFYNRFKDQLRTIDEWKQIV